ncbi:MAG: ABC transporter substrate-binding protein [Bacillota bacterium]
MKRFMVILLATILAVVAAVPAFAARPVVKYPVTFNGHPVTFEVQPTVINGRTFVPFRAIFEKMGADIKWDGATQTITATRGDKTVKLTIGSTTAYVNNEAKQIDAAPFIDPEYNRTLVPLRFVGEAFGATVDFNAATTAISIVDSNWPKRGGTLNLAMWNKPEGKFNPIMSSDTYSTNIGGMMYDSLWRYDERYTPIPALAEYWEWDETNTKLTFYLRDAKFFNGKKITAQDVVFTYKGIFHPKYTGPRNSGWQDLKGWEEYTKGLKGETADNFEKGIVTTNNIEGLYAIGDDVVVFELKQPNAPFLFQIAYGPIDSTKYANIPVQDWGSAKDPHNVYANGHGAFMMKEYVEGQYAILEANPTYWAGRPYIDRVIWRIIDPAVAVGEMQRGNIDFAEFSAPELESYQAMSHVKIHEFPDMLFQMMFFNTERGPTADKSVRQAINYAIDRQSIIHNLMKDHASTMYGPIHPLTWAYTDDVNHYDFNPAKSKEMLDAAGWTVGAGGVREKGGEKLKLRLIYPNVGNPVRQATAPVVQQMLKDVGVEVELVGMDWTMINTEVFEKHNFDLMFVGFSLGNSDPDPTGLWDKASTVPGGFNAAGWSTPLSEELIAKGKATGDIEERIEIYHEWSKHWVDESPALILYAVNTLIAQNDRLQNFKPGPQGYLWNLEELWLSK